MHITQVKIFSNYIALLFLVTGFFPGYLYAEGPGPGKESLLFRTGTAGYQASVENQERTASKNSAQILSATSGTLVTLDFGTTGGFGAGTTVTDQFKPQGVLFTGSDGTAAHIRNDGDNPTSPVLAGSSSFFNGPITAIFVEPGTTTPTTVAIAGALSTGFYNSIGSTRMQAFDSQGNVIASIVNQKTGIEAMVIMSQQANIAKIEFNTISTEQAGFAIDQFIYDKTIPKTSAADHTYSADSNDPVNTYTGELYNDHPPDLNLGGWTPLLFSRYYASGLDQAGISGTLGRNWIHNHEMKVILNGSLATVITSHGKSIDFYASNGSWLLYGRQDVPFQLISYFSGFALVDPRTKKIFEFDSTGKLIKIERANLYVHTLSYNGSDQLTQVADSEGRKLTYTYLQSPDPHTGKLSQVSDGTRTVSFSYTSGNLTGVTDPEGKTTTYTYDSGGLLTSTSRPSGTIPYSQTYDGNERVVTQTDSAGNTYSFSYSPPNTTITGPMGNTRVHGHTTTGEFNSRQDQAGKTFTLGSDETGRRNSITDRLNGTTSYKYHEPSGYPALITNADGTTESFSYTARSFSGMTSYGLTLYDLTGITYADNSTETFLYDYRGDPQQHTDQAGNNTNFSYFYTTQYIDETITNPAGAITVNRYNPDHTLQKIIQPQNIITTYGYDSLKRLNQVTYSDNATRSYTYDGRDNILTVTDENSNTASFSYDTNGNLASRTDPMGNTTTFTYDGNDRLLAITDPLTNTISYTYDQLARVKTITDKNGNTSTFGYDNTDRLTSVSDPKGNTWSTTYNDEGIPLSFTTPLGHTTNYVSDSMGRITQTTSPLGNTSSYSYDALGRVISTTNPLGQTTAMGRDSRGLVSSITLPGGAISTIYTRNSFGLITTLTDANNKNWQRAYNNQGQLTSTTDPLGNIQTFNYDIRSRPSLITFPGNMGTLTIGYDPAGNITSRTYQGGPILTYTYDANNRLTSANGLTLSYDADNLIIGSNTIDIVRDPGGRVTSMTLDAGNSKVISYSYDANDQLVQVSDWAGGATSFSYDAAGRRTSISRPNNLVTTYTYDADDRLVGISEGTTSNITLIRDGEGQITSASRSVPQNTTATGLPDRSNSFDDASQVATYNYDSMGRLTNDGTTTYTWDLASRLIGYTRAGNSTTFTNDALGNRISKTAAGMTTEYVWNYALKKPSPTVERQSGVDKRYYVYTPDGSLLYSIEASNNSRKFYHYDEMGNTLYVTNDSGSTVNIYAYDSFGRMVASTGGNTNFFTWQGEHGVMSEGNDLYYMRARYYDGNNGKFLSRDPISSITPEQINPYQYAQANPLKYIDPTGLREYEFASYPPPLKNKGKSKSIWDIILGRLTVIELSNLNQMPKAEFEREVESLKMQFFKGEALKLHQVEKPKPTKTCNTCGCDSNRGLEDTRKFLRYVYVDAPIHKLDWRTPWLYHKLAAPFALAGGAIGDVVLLPFEGIDRPYRNCLTLRMWDEFVKKDVK